MRWQGRGHLRGDLGGPKGWPVTGIFTWCFLPMTIVGVIVIIENLCLSSNCITIDDSKVLKGHLVVVEIDISIDIDFVVEVVVVFVDI